MIAYSEGIGQVYRCGCGAIKVQCGNTTLHLPLGIFMRFASMVDEASTKLIECSLRELLEEGDNEDSYSKRFERRREDYL
jgi:hypothetical protein